MDHIGNQLTKVTDAVANFVYIESADFKNYGGTAGAYTYNKNGSMATDSHKGILGIKYNSLNLPYELLIKNADISGKVYYTYSASGVKLKTRHLKAKNLGYTPVTGTSGDSNFDVIGNTDYVGNMIYEDGSLKRILVDGGYIENNVYHYYLNDHLGNNRMIVNQNGVKTQWNHYYPFGMAFADKFDNGTNQPYKYNGKELDQMHGLNLYDYSARYYESAIGRFTTVDPMAEKYYSISPYAYVGNNPMRLTDPTGMIWEDEEEAKKLKRNIQNRQVSLNQTIGNNLAKMFEGELSEKELNKLVAETSDALASIKNLGQAIDDIDRLGFDQENVYAFNKISGGQHNVRKDGSDGKIYIETSSNAISIHEITHVRQSLTSSGGLRFDPDGRLYNAGRNERGQAMMEVEGYQMQYSYDKSFPGNTKGKGLNGIDIHSVGNIRDNGILVYPNIYNYSNKLNKFIKEQSKLYKMK